MKLTPQPILKFKRYSIVGCTLSIKDGFTDEQNEIGIAFQFEPRFYEQTFDITYNIEISNKEKSLHISVTLVAYFETNEPLKEEFKTSNYITLNAPAIIYPYLRAFISTLTVNAGIEPIIIPVINFKAMEKKSDDTTPPGLASPSSMQP